MKYTRNQTRSITFALLLSYKHNTKWIERFQSKSRSFHFHSPTKCHIHPRLEHCFKKSCLEFNTARKRGENASVPPHSGIKMRWPQLSLWRMAPRNARQAANRIKGKG